MPTQALSFANELCMSTLINKRLVSWKPNLQHLLSERLTSLGIMGAPQVPPLNPLRVDGAIDLESNILI